jgi:CYTH domain-containing protein
LIALKIPEEAPESKDYFMKQEIERKFLVKDNSWRDSAAGGVSCRQGYLSSGPDGATVRVRLMGERGFLTVKGPARGISRAEFEYEIPAEDAEQMLDTLCGGRIVSKTRHFLPIDGLTWEIDEFTGQNSGLVLAEIELSSEEQSVGQPAWLGEEVSLDSRYTNAALSRTPFSRWKP